MTTEEAITILRGMRSGNIPQNEALEIAINVLKTDTDMLDHWNNCECGRLSHS